MSLYTDTYVALLERINNYGRDSKDRTGVGTRKVVGAMVMHHWEDGFPLLTLRKVPYKGAMAEAACFLKGITNHQALQLAGCNFWDANVKANPKYNVDPLERGLGRVYGAQWRRWTGKQGMYYDQVRDIVNEATQNPTSRRLMVTAWRPDEMKQMSLPPCHVGFQIVISPEVNKLDLVFNMRSVDVVLGMPADFVAYAYIQLALCTHLGYEPGTLTCLSVDTHVYLNHMHGVEEMLDRYSSITDVPFLPSYEVKTDGKLDFDLFLPKHIVLGPIEQLPAIDNLPMAV